MFEVLLIRPGSTTFDEEGRIKGALDIPLNSKGTRQVEETSQKLSQMRLSRLYVSPCESAQQTGKILAQHCGWKLRTIECFRNMDHGLWQGRLVEDVRRLQPKVYKQFQDSLINICPPGGESLHDARRRIAPTVKKIVRRHKHTLVGLVIPEPMASLVRSELLGYEFRDLWKAELDACTWELLRISSPLSATAFG